MQGITDLTGTKTRQIFSRMFVMAKLFASALNRIAASVRCVSSMIVVLNAKLTDYLRRMQTKTDDEKRRSPAKVTFLLVETHRHEVSIAVLTMHAEASLLYFLRIYASQ